MFKEANHLETLEMKNIIIEIKNFRQKLKTDKAEWKRDSTNQKVEVRISSRKYHRKIKNDLKYGPQRDMEHRIRRPNLRSQERMRRRQHSKKE